MKYRQPVNKVANRGLGGFSVPVVNLRGKKVRRDLQVIEIPHLFWFGFKVFPLGVGEDKIEDSDAPLNVFEFVFPAIAEGSRCRSGGTACARRGDRPSRSLGRTRCAHVFWREVCSKKPSCACPQWPQVKARNWRATKVAGMRGHGVKKAELLILCNRGLAGPRGCDGSDVDRKAIGEKQLV